MRHFFDPHIAQHLSKHTLEQEESKHIVRVLRMDNGDRLALLNGKGQFFSCTIIDANAKACIVSVDEVQHTDPDPYFIHVALAPTKQLERIEWFIEKATELGIHKITLFSSENSERVTCKPERFQKKIVSALKQSKRFYLPEISETIVPFTKFVENNPNGLIAHCYDLPKNSFSSSFNVNDCPILIGPEGDFSIKEVELAEKFGYKSISLGNTRLRTETAALYATALAKYQCE
jgi:16S rRNA (uracil1498-N3)-methyltransferase